MAFISLIFVYLVFFAIIMGVISVIGLIFLIIGLVRKQKHKGKKSPIVCMTIGIILLAIPLVTTVTTVVAFMTSMNDVHESTDYVSVLNKWYNINVDADEAADEAINELLEAADTEDRSRFQKMFSVNTRKKNDFDIVLDNFLESYPVGLSECELDKGEILDSNLHVNDNNVKAAAVVYVCNLEGKTYYIGMDFCYKNKPSMNDIGVESFYIMDEESFEQDLNKIDTEYLICSVISENAVSLPVE